MLPDWFVFLGLAISTVTIFRYVAGTLSGVLRPNVVSWSLWAAPPLLAYAVAVVDGHAIEGLGTIAAGLGPIAVVVAAAISRHGQIQISKLDVVCGTASLIGLAAWLASGSGAAGVLAAVAADAMASIPTVRHAWNEPDNESALTFAGSAVSATIALLVLDKYSFSNSAFPSYIAFIGVLIATTVAYRRKSLRRHARPAQ